MAKDVLNNINVNLNEVPNLMCDCGHKLYKKVFVIKKISALVSPTGKETIIPIEVYACDKCGTISSLFKNLNATDEIPTSEGESIQGSIKQDELPESPKKLSTDRLFIP